MELLKIVNRNKSTAYFKTLILFFLIFACKVFAADAEYVVCPGSGVACKVSSGGLSNPFDKEKGKDRGAIEIKL